MGNIALNKDDVRIENYMDFDYKNGYFNVRKFKSDKLNNTFQNGTNSRSSTNKVNKEIIKNKSNEKEKLQANFNKDLNSKHKLEIYHNIFKFIFPHPDENSNDLKKCNNTNDQDSSTKKEIPFQFNSNIKNFKYVDNRQSENSKHHFKNNSKELDLNVEEDYFSFLGKKMKDNNAEDSNLSKSNYDWEKINYINKDSKDRGIRKKKESRKALENVENNCFSQVLTKPDTLDENIANENPYSSIIEKKNPISIYNSSKNANENSIIKKIKGIKSCETFLLDDNTLNNSILESKCIISKNEEEKKINKKELLKFHCNKDLILKKHNSFFSLNNREQDNKQMQNNFSINNNCLNPSVDFELNYIKNSETIRRSYMAKLVYTNVWQPTKKEKDHNSLIVFDWDDTLLCTSFLTPNGLFIEDMELEKMEKEKMQILDNLVFKILNLAVENADTFIITNAEPGWVEYSAERFYPRVHSILKKVKILSARGEFEKKHPNNSRQWKIQSFLKMAIEFDKDLITNFICLGDSLIEMEAAHIFVSKFTKAFIKTVKFKESPNLDELIKELTLVSNQFLMIFSAIKNLTIRVEKKTRKSD